MPLVAEIKDRARKALARKDMPVCDALYTKAIETLPSPAIELQQSERRAAHAGAKATLDPRPKLTEGMDE